MSPSKSNHASIAPGWFWMVTTGKNNYGTKATETTMPSDNPGD